MLPSRASVPSPGIEKKEPELATPTKPSVPMSPSVKHHPGLTIPSPEKNNNNDGTPRKKFKYVKPRLGGNFQAKIGAFVPKTKNDSDELNVSMSSASLPPASSSSTGTGIKKKRMGRPPKGGKSKQQQETSELLHYDPSIRTKRGGLCIHKPSSSTNSHDRFLTFSRNLQLQTPRDATHNIERADYLWGKACQESRFQRLEKVEKEKKKGKKRKLMEKVDNNSDASVVAGTSASIAMTMNVDQTAMDVDENDGSDANDTIAETALGTENDYGMLEYLQIKGSGQVARAQFLSLVELCRGTAVRTRRRARKSKKKEDIDEDSVPLSALIAPLSYTWRGRYESSQTTIIGDHRKNAGHCSYPYFVSGDSSTSALYPWTRNWNVTGNASCEDTDGASKRKRPINADWDTFEKIERNEELISCWTSILEKGQTVVDNYENGHKPKIVDLFLLLKKAYSIPNPEEVFGKRDTMPKRIAQCLNSIIDLIDNGRDVLAHITDAMYDESDDGIELQNLRKIIDAKSEILKVHLGELSIARDILAEALEWESRLTEISRTGDGESSSSEDLHLPNQSLSSAEDQGSRGRLLVLRPNTLVSLEGRIRMAYDLRNRIRSWNKNNENDKDSVKSIGTMIKEANKINLSFPELSLLSKVHRNAEEWLDRASVALRSKISLNELESLVKTGEKMPLGLTGTLEKLQSRYKQACNWIVALKEEVPCPLESMSASGCDLDAGNRAEWLLRIRNTLNSGSDDCVSTLAELSSQGSRLPIEIDFLQLLQTAIDARNWSQKARRWVPSSGDQFKRGKLEDLQDHLDNAQLVLKRAEELTEGKADWKLDVADELQTIVDKAEEWFETYRPFLTGDNRRANSRNQCSFATLKTIVEEAEQIPSNLGNSFGKINRIYNDAEEWMETHRDLLQRCGINAGTPNDSELKYPVSIDEVNDAIKSAARDLAVDLDEAKKLEDMAAQSQTWFDQALIFAPKRNKRTVGNNKICAERCTMDKVVSLIESSTTIPMDTSEDVERLQLLLSDVQSWRLQARQNIIDISQTIDILAEERIRFYGKSNEFLKDQAEPMELETGGTMIPNDDEKKGEDTPLAVKGNGIDVYKMVEALVKSIDSVDILTFEEEIAKQVETIMKWCKKASGIIDAHENIYTDKRWKRDLNALIKDSSAINLSYVNCTTPLPNDDSESKIIFDALKNSIGALQSDDLSRLDILRVKRDGYYAWCKKANDSYIESDKRVPLEKIAALAEECKIYPSNAETVKKISRDARIAFEWVADAKHILESGNPLSLDEVKSKLNKVSRVKFTCPEYVTLKKAQQQAKSWLNRLCKSGINDGSGHIHVLKDLLREHEELIITLPIEEERLQSALCAYCVCRRPYEGFMIGCDECEEWYHGPCIGVTQSQGDKMEKYVCTRCCVKRVYKISSKKVASIVRKWCDKKDLSKARSQDNQKHQRKIREKKRDIEKWRNECRASIEQLQSVKQRKRDRQNAIESAKLQAAVAEDQLTLGVPSIPVIDLGGAGPRLEEEEAAAETNISKATFALEHANHQLADLTKLSNDRKANQYREDILSNSFRYWVAMIRCQVLAPETLEIAETSRPKPDLNCTKPSQLLSEKMNQVLEITSELGISGFPDISVVRDAFQCIGWACLAFGILKKKPAIDELRCLRDLSNFVRLPEVKSVHMIKTMISRTSVWRSKAKKALAPVPNESKPFDLDMLKELGIGLSAIPVMTPEEVVLCNVISDEGARQCICGGPRDEICMKCCSSCSKWYHQGCVNTLVDAQEAVEGIEWKCQFCNDGITPTIVKNKATKNLIWPFLGSWHESISPHAPLPNKIWPPFGLSHSPEAQNKLGISLSFRLEHMVKPTPKTPVDIEDSVKKMMTGRAKMSTSGVPASPPVPPPTLESDKVVPGNSQSLTQSLEHLAAIPTSPSFLAAQFSIFGNAPVISQSNGTSSNLTSPRVLKSHEINHLPVTSGPAQNYFSPQTQQIVEGIPNDIIQDALIVARSVAEAIPIVQTAYNPPTSIANVTNGEANHIPTSFVLQGKQIVTKVDTASAPAVTVALNGFPKSILYPVKGKYEDRVVINPVPPAISQPDNKEASPNHQKVVKEGLAHASDLTIYDSGVVTMPSAKKDPTTKEKESIPEAASSQKCPESTNC